METKASLAHSLIFNYCLLQVKEDRLFEPNSSETSLIKFQLQLIKKRCQWSIKCDVHNILHQKKNNVL